MSEQPAGLGPGTDIRPDDIDLEPQERPGTADPEALADDETLGGLGGADRTAGGAG